MTCVAFINAVPREADRHFCILEYTDILPIIPFMNLNGMFLSENCRVEILCEVSVVYVLE